MIKNAGVSGSFTKLSYINTSKIIVPLRIFLQFVFFMMLRLFYSIKSIGKENLDMISGPAIFAINHTSHFDTPTLFRALPFRFRSNIAFAAAQDYFFVKEKDKDPSYKPRTGRACKRDG